MGKREATIDDLYHVEGKAELVNGELALFPMTSGLHGFAAGAVFASLHAYQRQTKRGYALPDSVGFVVNLPHRRSFGPDAAFCTQARSEEHTSELQSHSEISYAVFCLKKKK